MTGHIAKQLDELGGHTVTSGGKQLDEVTSPGGKKFSLNEPAKPKETLQEGVEQGFRNIDNFKTVLKNVDDFGKRVVTKIDDFGKQTTEILRSIRDEAYQLADGVFNPNFGKHTAKVYMPSSQIDEGAEATKRFTLNGDVSPSTSNLDNFSGKLDDGLGLKGNIPDKPLVNAGQPLDGVEAPSTTFNLNNPQGSATEVPSIKEPPKPKSELEVNLPPEPPVVNLFDNGNRWQPNAENIFDNFVTSTNEDVLVQQDFLRKVRSGELELELGTNQMRKGNYGEMMQDEYFRQLGYERISLDTLTDIDAPTHRGIDGVYYNPNGKPPYVISEAKYNKDGIASLSNTKTYGRQMGDKWIRGNLIDAVDEDMYYDILEAMGEGNVGSYLFNIQKNDQVDLIMLRNGKKVK